MVLVPKVLVPKSCCQGHEKRSCQVLMPMVLIPKGARARNLGPPKNPKIKNSQNQNPFCPKCRQGFFMPEKGVPAPFGALPAHFLRGPGNSKNCKIFAYFP